MATLKFSIHSSLAQVISKEVNTGISNYYFGLGRSYPWNNTDTLRISNDSLLDEYDARKDLVKYSYISQSDVCIVIDRVDWIQGMVFDDYDDYNENMLSYSGVTDLYKSTFYCVNTDYNVYKCISNNNNAASLEMPTQTKSDPVTHDSDGYIWKFMYNIPLYLRNKFLSSTVMPVTTAFSSQFYSVGQINNVIIVDKGSNYNINYTGTGLILPNNNMEKLNRINGINSLFLTELKINSKIKINDEIYTVAGITSNTELTIKEFIYVTEMTDFIIINTYIEVDGDGTRSRNPYILDNIIIENGGVNQQADTAGTGTIKSKYAAASVSLTGIGTKFISEVFVGSILKIGVESFNVKTIVSDTELTISTSALVATLPFTIMNTYVIISDPPVKEGNRRARAKISSFGANNSIASIEILDPGFGYISPPTIRLPRNNGSAFAVMRLNPALIYPIVSTTTNEITAINIFDSGEGYTYASAKVKRTFEPVNPITVPLESNVSLSISNPSVNTSQAVVESTVTKGAIYNIKITDGGLKYTSNPINIRTQQNTVVTVIGDGIGCTAYAVINNGLVEKIRIDQPGINYTYADVIIEDVTGNGHGATARAVISPVNGHGSNAVNELFGRTLLFHNKLNSDNVKDVPMSNGYRQVTLIKNPKKYNSKLAFTNFIGSPCFKVTLAELPTNRAVHPTTTIFSNDIVYISTYKFRVIAVNAKDLLLLEIDSVLDESGNYLINTDSKVSIKVGTDTYVYDIDKSTGSILYPDVDKYSGDLIYIDNRESFKATPQQVVAISSRFKV